MVWAGTHVAKVTIGVWNEDAQHYKLYSDTLERRAGQNVSITPKSRVLPGTLSAAEWKAHVITGQPQAAAPQPAAAAQTAMAQPQMSVAEPQPQF